MEKVVDPDCSENGPSPHTLDLNRLLQTGHCHRCSIAVIHRVRSIGSGRSTAAINFFVWRSLVQRKRPVAAYPRFESVTPDRSLPPLFHCGRSSGAFDREQSFNGGNQLFCLAVACAAVAGYCSPAASRKPHCDFLIAGQESFVAANKRPGADILSRG